MKDTISIRLFKALLKGRDQLSEEAVERIARFVVSQRLEDESFMDKSGKADLYYTAFGWMLCYALGIACDHRKMKAYLSALDADRLDLIHYAAFIRCRMIQRLFEGGKVGLLLKSFFPAPVKPLPDFSVPHKDWHSPYTRFIWLSLSEDTKSNVQSSRFKVQGGDSTKNLKPGTLNFELSPYHVKGGGYMNTTDGLTATTNATVAALAIRGQLDGYEDNEDIRFLRHLQESSGGFGAAKGSPLPDLLSTATSLFLLSCYGVQPKYPARDFIEAHWLESGGFSATLLDEVSDVEYTFYGLLALGSIF